MKNKFHHYAQWYQYAEGDYVLAQIDTYLATQLQAIFGYYALELGVLAGQHDFLASSRIADRYRVAAHPHLATSSGTAPPQMRATELKPDLKLDAHPIDICAETEFLPIMADNIDLIFASHVLECSNKPHQVLREIDRVLVPEGHCFLLGFNPMSFAGLQHRFVRQEKQKQDGKRSNNQHYRLHPAHQTKDWLKLLGFNILTIKHFAYRPAIALQPTWLASIWRSLAWMESIGTNYLPALGSVYLIHAQKQVMARLPPVKKRRLRVLPEAKPVIAISKGGNHRVSQKSSPVD
ncbi:MAG TPA: methyltransferase domain-containing protein [Thiothrix sp.]|nr:methyltransferase domain-containing protein [Thiothrix sp.]